MSERKWPKHDKAFEDYKRDHPEMTFAKFFAQKTFDNLQKPGAFHATLGTSLYNEAGRVGDWWEGGERLFRKFQKIVPVQAASKVVEYGCGSLRVGAQYIKFLEPGNFFGLDVIEGFYEMGKRNVGEALLAEKRPRLAEITEQSIAEAAAFGPDLTFASTVASHVYPPEAADFYGALAHIAHRGRLMFNVVMTDEPIRFSQRSWFWPQDYFVEMLPSFELLKVHDLAERTKRNAKINVGIMEFRPKERRLQ